MPFSARPRVPLFSSNTSMCSATELTPTCNAAANVILGLGLNPSSITGRPILLMALSAARMVSRWDMYLPGRPAVPYPIASNISAIYSSGPLLCSLSASQTPHRLQASNLQSPWARHASHSPAPWRGSRPSPGVDVPHGSRSVPANPLEASVSRSMPASSAPSANVGIMHFPQPSNLAPRRYALSLP